MSPRSRTPGAPRSPRPRRPHAGAARGRTRTPASGRAATTAGAEAVPPIPVDRGAAACGDRKLRLPADDRRSQILAAALEVFSEQGFHGTRTRELAARAGVSEALVFSHFPNKEAILRAIFDLLDFEGRIRHMESAFSRMPPREALLALAEFVLTNLRDQPDVFRVVFFGVLETPELAGRFYHQFISRVLTLEAKLLAKAHAERGDRGPGTAIDPAVEARSFHGTLFYHNIAGAILRLEPLPRDPKALAATIVNIYLPEGTS